jgi:hypothetical protein
VLEVLVTRVTLRLLRRPSSNTGICTERNFACVSLACRDFNVVSYTLLLALIEFKTLVMRQDLSGAFALLPNIPSDQINGVARFLEAKGLVQEALDIATDPDYRCDIVSELLEQPQYLGWFAVHSLVRQAEGGRLQLGRRHQYSTISTGVGALFQPELRGGPSLPLTGQGFEISSTMV